jgi:hypothetical protein
MYCEQATGVALQGTNLPEVYALGSTQRWQLPVLQHGARPQQCLLSLLSLRRLREAACAASFEVQVWRVGSASKPTSTYQDKMSRVHCEHFTHTHSSGDTKSATGHTYDITGKEDSRAPGPQNADPDRHRHNHTSDRRPCKHKPTCTHALIIQTHTHTI